MNHPKYHQISSNHCIKSSAQLHRSCQPSSWWPASQHSASVTYQCDAFDFKPSPESVALRFPGSPLDEDIAQSSRVSSLVGEVVVFRSIRNAAKPKECDIHFFCCNAAKHLAFLIIVLVVAMVVIVVPVLVAVVVVSKVINYWHYYPLIIVIVVVVIAVVVVVVVAGAAAAAVVVIVAMVVICCGCGCCCFWSLAVTKLSSLFLFLPPGRKPRVSARAFVLRNGQLRYIHTSHMSTLNLCSNCYGMDCFGTYFTHVQSCNVTRVQSATEWNASVHISHMSKPVMQLVFKVLRNGLLRYILHTCPKLYCNPCPKMWHKRNQRVKFQRRCRNKQIQSK